jgi:gas vesicle protein
MSSGKVLLGVLAGFAAGALLGVLFAPDKGSVTRKTISKKSDDYADALRDKFNEFLDSINEKFEKVKEEADNVIPKAEEVK